MFMLTESSMNCATHGQVAEFQQICDEVKNRSGYVSRYRGIAYRDSILGQALDRLIITQVQLYRSLIAPTQIDSICDSAHDSLESVRRAGQAAYLPFALMCYSWATCCSSDSYAKTLAQSLLDEAWDIAERGPMRLHMADIHLYRARLFFRDKEYPWREGRNLNGEFVTNRTAADDLAAAEKLINECGYHRRDEELADAKRAILGAA